MFHISIVFSDKSRHWKSLQSQLACPRFRRFLKTGRLSFGRITKEPKDLVGKAVPRPGITAALFMNYGCTPCNTTRMCGSNGFLHMKILPTPHPGEWNENGRSMTNAVYEISRCAYDIISQLNATWKKPVVATMYLGEP